MDTHYIDCLCGSFKDVLQVTFDIDQENKQCSHWYLCYALYPSQLSFWQRIKFLLTGKIPIWFNGDHMLGLDAAKQLRMLLDDFIDKTVEY